MGQAERSDSEEERSLGYNELMSKLDEETLDWWENIVCTKFDRIRLKGILICSSLVRSDDRRVYQNMVAQGTHFFLR